MKRIVAVAVLVAVIGAAALWLRLQVAPLSAIVRGGEGPPALVLLHGYGSRAEDWLQFEGKIQVPDNGRLILPQAPLRGPGGARGWWWLHLEGYVPEGGGMPDLSRGSPGGIKVASRLLREYLEDVPGPVVLGGFSQGAMLSAEVAFQTDQELAALIMLGGTTVNEEAWAERFPGRRHLPIFIAHGRQDSVLSFAIAERFANRLKVAGLNVKWVPFNGGHEVPDFVIRELNEFLTTLQFAP